MNTAITTPHAPLTQSNNKLVMPQITEENILVSYAMPLLALMVSLRTATATEQLNIEELREQIIKQIQIFEFQSKQAKYNSPIVSAARYCLCAAIDEAVLDTEWGSNSIWAKQSLLATMYNETLGGERFYAIIEKTIDEALTYLDLLELTYYILSLGFEGVYFNNKDKHEEIRKNLVYIISSHKPSQQEMLSPFEKPNIIDSQKTQYSPSLLVLLIAMLIILFIIASSFQYFTDRLAMPILTQLNKIAL